MPAGCVETVRTIVHPWHCDVIGHMNTRFYAAMFDDAGMSFMASIGWAPGQGEPNLGWADVRNVTEFHKEVPVGTLVAVTTRIGRLGIKSLTLHHALRCCPGDELRATMEATLVCFDLSLRRARPLPELLRRQLSAAPG